MAIAIVGLDLAKHVFQVHAIDETGRAILRRQLRRASVEVFFKTLSPCVVGMEACASAHYWARRISALGHEVRLIAPAKVKPYVQRGKKNDANDAAAIVEAVMRPHMVFVPIKNEEQQAVPMLHRTRDLLVRQRTMLVNAIRAHLAEFGIVAAQGRRKVKDLITGLDNTEIPELARLALWQIADQIDECDKHIDALEWRSLAWHKSDAASCNLATIPGIGPITASAIAATVPNPSAFRNGRQLAAWLGLVPRQNSSGGKDRLSGITKAGNTYIRRLLVIGATSVIRFARSKAPGTAEWLKKLLERKSARLASVALANKMARIAWSYSPGARSIEISIPCPSRPEPKGSARKETRRARLKCEVMAIRSSRDWEDPKWPRHKLCDEVIGTRSAEFVMACGHASRIFRGRTHDCT